MFSRAAGMGIEARCCPVGGRAPGATGVQLFGVGAANTGDDALDFYASSGKCAKAKEGAFLKLKARWGSAASRCGAPDGAARRIL